MSILSPADWPADPDALAVLAFAPSEATSRRAFTDLMPHLHRIAARAAARFPRPIRDDLVAEAPGRLWEACRRGRAAFRAGEGTFEGWFATVVRHLGLSRLRQTTPTRLGCPEGVRAPDAGQGAEAADELRERLARLRSILDRLSRAEIDGSVDWYAVLLMHLRLALAGRVSRTWGGARPPHGEAAAQVARLLPWRPGESGRAFTPAAPPLGAVWDAVSPALDAPPYRIEAAPLCAAAALSSARWHQWAKRARSGAGAGGAGRLVALLRPAAGRPNRPLTAFPHSVGFNGVPSSS